MPGWSEVWISKHPKISYQTACDTQEEAERIGGEVERYIPVLALLSDEAIAVMVRALERPYEWARQSKEEFTKDAVQALVEQVGGGCGG